MIALTIIASICKRTFNNSYSLKESDNKALSYVGQGFSAGYVEQSLINLIGDENEVLKIYPNNDWSTYGWCMQHGASLIVNSGTISAEEDGYISNNAKSGYNGSIQWLLPRILSLTSAFPASSPSVLPAINTDWLRSEWAGSFGEIFPNCLKG